MFCVILLKNYRKKLYCFAVKKFLVQSLLLVSKVSLSALAQWRQTALFMEMIGLQVQG